MAPAAARSRGNALRVWCILGCLARRQLLAPNPPLTHPLGAVVVCAPTGAGKTAIAEAAAMHFVSRGQRVLYTTPLKALSNQKLLEFRERFG